jgi:hypothetical protein
MDKPVDPEELQYKVSDIVNALAASGLNVTRMTVHNWIKHGVRGIKLPAVDCLGLVVIRISDLRKFLRDVGYGN